MEALPSALVPAIWAGLGFQIIVFLAELRAIPVEYYEAAEVDGVSRLSTFLDITLPLLRPTFLFLVVLGSIGSLRIFDQVYNLLPRTSTPAGRSTPASRWVLMIYQYRLHLLRHGLRRGSDRGAVPRLARTLDPPAQPTTRDR